ncbi:MAG: MATE family efflux transporter [Clostridia bacterium]|nr:MATE family efflux transporter [Clostridia bacterium]
MFKKREMNMCEGAILKKLIVYALPLMATNVLQLLFNAADVAVLGIFKGDAPVGAVGSTGALINLIVGLFVGLSVGANVLIARCVGENNEKRARRIVGMSMLISVVIGVLLSIVGIVFARTFLSWMQCPENRIDLATKYLQIYFIGAPIMLLYNFCASILRAVGDTLRPLIFLLISGIANVGLNVLFVTVFNKDVEGVAIATITSQAVSAVLSVITLLKGKGFAKLELRRIKIYPKELLMMIKIGLPSGIQGCLFSLSNVLIQSSINAFGGLVVDGNAIAMQLDGFIFTSMNAISLSSLAFVSQNLGANNYERIKKTLWRAIGLVVVVGVVVSAIIMAISPAICSFIADSEDVANYALIRVYMIASTYFLCGIMDVLSNSLRGLGRSALAMSLTLIGTCLLRVVYVWTVIRSFKNLYLLYAIYPISYVISIVMFVIAYVPVMRSIKRQIANKKEILQMQENPA